MVPAEAKGEAQDAAAAADPTGARAKDEIACGVDGGHSFLDSAVRGTRKLTGGASETRACCPSFGGARARANAGAWPARPQITPVVPACACCGVIARRKGPCLRCCSSKQRRLCATRCSRQRKLPQPWAHRTSSVVALQCTQHRPCASTGVGESARIRAFAADLAPIADIDAELPKDTGSEVVAGTAAAVVDLGAGAA